MLDSPDLSPKKLAIGLLLAILVYQLANGFLMHMLDMKHRVLMQGFFEQDMTLTLFKRDRQGVRSNIDTISIKGGAPQTDQRYWFDVGGEVFFEVGLEFELDAPESGADPKPIQFHFIGIDNALSQNMSIVAADLPKFFASDNWSGHKDGEVEFDRDTHRINLISKGSTSPPNRAMTIGLALLVAVVFLLLFLYTSVWSLAAFRDISVGRTMTDTAEFNIINGIRGFSAILVLMSHSAPGFFAHKMGLALLFVMSGYLLSKPFVINNTAIFSWNAIGRFLVKRLKRILPMYYFTVFLIYGVSFQFEHLARHVLFIESKGHLWAIPQILTFYLMLPFILVLTSLLTRVHRWLPFIVVVIAIFVWRHYAPFVQLFYNGMYYERLMTDIFLIGVAAAYLQYGIVRNNDSLQSFMARYKHAISAIAIIFTTLVMAWAAPVTPPEWIKPYMGNFSVKAFLAAIIILLAVNTKGSLFSFLFGNRFMQSIGVVGYSFYLLHGLGIELVTEFERRVLGYSEAWQASWQLTAWAFIVTYCMAVLAYSCIERLFFGKTLRASHK